jgi:hypothetical protein
MRKRKSLQRRVADVDTEPHGGNERGLRVANRTRQVEEGIAAEIKKGVTITRNAFI